MILNGMLMLKHYFITVEKKKSYVLSLQSVRSAFWGDPYRLAKLHFLIKLGQPRRIFFANHFLSPFPNSRRN